MTNDIERRLAPYLFPVKEVGVFKDGKTGPNLTKDYKAIVSADDNRLIAIQRNTYKLVPNADVIRPLMEQLHRLDTSWYIDSSHSFVELQRMRLQVTFPELVLNDGKSDIALSLYLLNSYDSSLGVKVYFGAIRSICKNGLIAGTVLSKFYGKHTLHLDLHSLHRDLSDMSEKLPVLKHRIDALLETKVDKNLRLEIDRNLGKRVTKYIEEQEREVQRAQNQWALYNIITYYISHMIMQRMRTDYQLRASKIFGL